MTVARWLILELRSNGHATDDRPEQEDFGWYFGFEAGDVKHDVVIAYRPETDPGESEWRCWIERKAGLIGSILGRRNHVEPDAVNAVFHILRSAPIVSTVRLCSKNDL